MAVQTQIQTRRGTAASWTSTNPTLAAGEIGFETDTGKFKIGNGSTAWVALAYSAGATAVTYLFNATAGQTTFSGADANSLTLAYTVGAEQVYLNGVLLVRTTDYTATNGTSIVLASGAVASDVLNVIAYSAMTITDTYTQAQANATFPLNTSAFFAGKNKIINGDFSVWQRGTTFTNTGSVFCADRWLGEPSGANTTYSQQTFTPGTAPVAGYEGQYFLRIAAGTADDNWGVDQRIEDVRTLAGQTITISFWAKSDATRTLNVYTSQNFGSGGSASVSTTPDTKTLSTSWQRFTSTIALASVAGKTIGSSSFLQILLRHPVNSTGQIDLWGVQVEAGSVATAFQTATGTIQGELAACQRYYWRSVSGGAYGVPAPSGFISSTTNAILFSTLPVPMRVAPTSIEFSTMSVIDAFEVAIVPSTVTLNTARTTTTVLSVDTPLVGGTAGRFAYGRINNSTSGYLAASAEL